MPGSAGHSVVGEGGDHHLYEASNSGPTLILCDIEGRSSSILCSAPQDHSLRTEEAFRGALGPLTNTFTFCWRHMDIGTASPWWMPVESNPNVWSAAAVTWRALGRVATRVFSTAPPARLRLLSPPCSRHPTRRCTGQLLQQGRHIISVCCYGLGKSVGTFSKPLPVPPIILTIVTPSLPLSMLGVRCSSACGSSRQDKTGQDKTGQGKKGQDSAGQDRTRRRGGREGGVMANEDLER